MTAGNRMVRTLRRLPTDRVPIHENVIDGQFIRYALGLEGVRSSLLLEPADHVRLARHVHLDLLTLGYVSRVAGLRTREALRKAVLPSHEAFLARVDRPWRLSRGRTWASASTFTVRSTPRIYPWGMSSSSTTSMTTWPSSRR